MHLGENYRNSCKINKKEKKKQRNDDRWTRYTAKKERKGVRDEDTKKYFHPQTQLYVH
jgi:hypothetical protein